jgi:hypothetical protein
MPWRAETARLEVDFLGADGYGTEYINVDPGDHLNFVIMPGN